MIDDIFKAIGQMSDPKFIGVLLRGIGLTVLLLVLTTLFVLWLLPNSVSLPWFGELEWLSSVLDGFAIVSRVSPIPTLRTGPALG